MCFRFNSVVFAITCFSCCWLNAVSAMAAPQNSILSKPTATDEGEEPAAEAEVSLGKARLVSDGPEDAEQVTLRYKFAEGEDVRWTIEQKALTELSSQGNVQDSRMRAVSTRKWHVTKVDSDGNITFEQSIEDANMASMLSDRPEVKYNSRSNDPVPQEFQAVAETIGKVIATFTVSPHGTVLKRVSDLPPQDLGLGDVVIPFPEQAIRVGATWDNDGSLQAFGEVAPVQIKTRQRYYLKDVANGVATITVETQVITPIRDARIRAQIMQQMTSGTIQFDMQRGRVWTQTVVWDEEVLGFSTPDSRMKYNATYTEQLRTGDTNQANAAFEAGRRVAQSPFTSTESIRIQGELPIIRR